VTVNVTALVLNHFALILTAFDFGFFSIGEPDFVLYHNQRVNLVIEAKTI